jgi:hypothetical protein
MRVESVDTPSLLELRVTVAQRLQAYGAFDGYTAEHRRTILAQACMVIWHLTAAAQGRIMYLMHLEPTADRARHQTVLDTMTRPCPDVSAAVQGYIAMWRARFWQDGWHPTQWGGCCDGVNRTILEVFVTDSRQALATCERDVPGASVLLQRDRGKG